MEPDGLQLFPSSASRYDLFVSATRILRRPSGAVVAVRRARLRVARGPSRGAELVLSSLDPVVIGSDADADLVLADDTVSARHAEIRPTARGWIVRDLGSTNGVVIGEVRVGEALLDERTRRLALGESELEWKLYDDEVEHLLAATPLGGLVGEAPAMRALFALVEQAAPSDSTVLLEGESGTGKEVLAEALYRASARAEKPFLVVDCAALAPSLVESELFGHEKGAFTGADRARAGALEEASGGTLFLDEIGELPLEQQVKLLRALEAREVRRLGAARAKPIDVRVVAATHRRLERLVAAGQFRADLYYRLAVIKLHLPALRDRAEDILPLARRFVAELRPGLDPAALLTDAVAAALTAHRWPGNVRELRNAVERLILVGQLATELRAPAAPPEYETARRRALDEFEREYCRAVLAHAGGNVSRAAAAAGLSRQMLHRLLRKHDLRGGEGDE
jgi:two-component system, NtrC family, response regulator GlrR